MWHVWGTGEMNTVFFMGRTYGMSPLGRTRHRWESNIEVELQEVLWRGLGWIGTGGGLLSMR